MECLVPLAHSALLSHESLTNRSFTAAAAAARYDPKQIIITENGVSAPKEDSMTVQQATRDDFRVNYYK
jgi:beta-glucosidase/6-phospho-beta-glucosidase/beta-galactosidase